MKLRDYTRILLVGFMGAGKSSVGRELARLLDDSFVDLDESITKMEGRTPSELIDEDGEESFRAAETRALLTAFDYGTARVIALGGGALTSSATRELIAGRNCFIIWLDAPFELCWQRIEGDDSRPFAREREQARRLYEERREFYALADCRVEVGAGKSVEAVAAEINEIVRSRIKWVEGWS
jgi:shikimate kinase